MQSTISLNQSCCYLITTLLITLTIVQPCKSICRCIQHAVFFWYFFPLPVPYANAQCCTHALCIVFAPTAYTQTMPFFFFLSSKAFRESFFSTSFLCYTYRTISLNSFVHLTFEIGDAFSLPLNETRSTLTHKHIHFFPYIRSCVTFQLAWSGSQPASWPLTLTSAHVCSSLTYCFLHQ